MRAHPLTIVDLGKHMTAAGLSAPRFSGMIYNPMADDWRLSEDTDVNYLAAGKG